MAVNVIERAAEFVRCPSMNPMGRIDVEIGRDGYGEARMASLVAAHLRAIGGAVSEEQVIVGRPNVTALFDFGARETILFEAHLDTVPAEGMTIAAFGGEVRDGRLYGRGACDVKGPMAAMVTAIEEVSHKVRHSADAARYNVSFAAVCDEEYGFSGVKHLVGNLGSADKSGGRANKILYAVIAEPTDLDLIVAHKGAVRLDARARGQSAHSSRPEDGKNAIYVMSRAVIALEKFADDLRRERKETSLGTPRLSVGTIRGGSAVNIVPDECIIQIDRRLVPGETPEGAEQEIRAILEPMGLEISSSNSAAPSLENTGSIFQRATKEALAAARAAGYTNCQTRNADYCTDASFFGACGIPAIVFGPGSMVQAHTNNEWISKDALDAGVRAYSAILTG